MQERADLTNQRQVPAIRSVQKTVEVPRVQYNDKVTDIPADMQRQVSTTQAAQDIEEVEDVPALTQSEVPNIPDDDEDWLEQESKRRKIPTPADAVSESRADESDFDRFDDLVLPSPEGKTIFMSIASGDEAEDGSDKEQEMTRCHVQGGESMLVDETDAESPGRQMVQVVHAEWSQELPEVQKKFADDMASEMTDVKNELAWPRDARSSGPQRKVRRNQGGNCGQTTGQDGAGTTRSRRCRARSQPSGGPCESVEGREGACRQMVRRQRLRLRESPDRRNRLHPR